MFAQVEQRVKVSKNVLVARISAVDCTNLKSSLKAILSNVSSWVDSEDEDDVLPNSGKVSVGTNYGGGISDSLLGNQIAEVRLTNSSQLCSR